MTTAIPPASAMMQDLIGRAGAARQPAADMQDLARRVRALLDLDRERDGRVRLGGSLYDAVITGGGAEGRAAVAALDAIQNGCGPVITDPENGWLYWLVPPGSSRTWEDHPHAVCIGDGHTLTLPARSRTQPPGPYWLRPQVADRLVPVRPLRKVLTRYRVEPACHSCLAAFLSRNTPTDAVSADGPRPPRTSADTVHPRTADPGRTR